MYELENEPRPVLGVLIGEFPHEGPAGTVVYVEITSLRLLPDLFLVTYGFFPSFYPVGYSELS